MSSNKISLYSKIFRRYIHAVDIEDLILKNKRRFDGNLMKVCINEIGEGKCTADMEVCEEHTNLQNSLHIGMTFTLVDALTTFGLLSHKNSEMVDTVSVDLILSFIVFNNIMGPIFYSFKRAIGTEMIRQFLHKQRGFEQVLKKMKVIEAGNGICLTEFKIDKEHINSRNALHSGLITTLVDSVTSCAFFTHKTCEGSVSVSVNINIKFFNEAYIGDTILVHAKTAKAGNTMGYLECTLSNKANGDIVATGTHVKYLLSSDK
ncbi:hypothetical protein RN001_005261 [Aquatica leii]|uniref:Acyl-coenzyme A thioesterase 13 n=1 Tax=Aquatica leii TaxID=1421715 RepID=A0AAN7SHT3_9COLE|nr:hypothetical protein RN001_005261 [Aquatica leii]